MRKLSLRFSRRLHMSALTATEANHAPGALGLEMGNIIHSRQ